MKWSDFLAIVCLLPYTYIQQYQGRLTFFTLHCFLTVSTVLILGETKFAQYITGLMVPPVLVATLPILGLLHSSFLTQVILFLADPLSSFIFFLFSVDLVCWIARICFGPNLSPPPQLVLPQGDHRRRLVFLLVHLLWVGKWGSGAPVRRRDGRSARCRWCCGLCNWFGDGFHLPQVCNFLGSSFSMRMVVLFSFPSVWFS